MYLLLYDVVLLLLLFLFLCSPKGEAYSRRFVRPSVTVACPANNFKTTVAIYIKLGIYIDDNEGKGRTQEP